MPRSGTEVGTVSYGITGCQAYRWCSDAFLRLPAAERPLDMIVRQGSLSMCSIREHEGKLVRLAVGRPLPGVVFCWNFRSRAL